VSFTKGSTIGHYRIEEKIGSGGMGDVYLATDSRLGRSVVLKTVAARCEPDEVVKLRFLQEAQSTAALNHPNIVTIYEVAESDGHVFMTMEHVAGKTLERLLEQGPPDCEKSLDVTTQVCRGLQAAHKAGVVHRDIKPGNIMVDDAGHVKILDFGLARLEGSNQITRTGALVGTVGYMSPEQGQGLKTDHRTDIFSTGVVLYELLAGRSPFQRDGIAATIHAIVCEQPPPLAACAVSAPRSLQQVLDRALAKDPADRYQSIDDMLADLMRIRNSETLAPHAPPSARSGRTKTRTLAVLYLRNLGSDDDEYLSYGITEDLIVDLTRLGSIRVLPMRKILKFKDSDKDVEEIARELDVSLVLDGSIHKQGDTVRVSAQLVDTNTGENVWAERWEKTPEELAQIKQELAGGVSRTLEVSRSAIRRAEVGVPMTANARAYEYYLRGRYAFERKQDHSDSEIALSLFGRALSEEPSLLAARVGVAQVLMHRSKYDQANRELLTALTEARRQNSRADEAMILRTLASSQTAQSHWKRAMKFANQALEISTTVGDLSGEGEALELQIQILTHQARFSEALKLLERVLEINRRLGDQQQMAHALKSMGFLHIRRGDYVRGQALSRRALAIAQKKDNRSLEAMCLKNIGITWEFMGKLDRAREYYDQALEIFTQLGDNSGRAACFNNIAMIHYAQGMYRKATEFFGKAAMLQKESGNRASYALSHNNIATPLGITGDYDRAIEVSKEALRIATEIDYPLVIHDANNCLGFHYFCKGDFKQAEHFFQAALDTAREGQIKRAIAMTHSHMGEMYYHLEDDERCREHSEKAVAIGKEISIREFELKADLHLAAQIVRDGRTDDGIARLRELLEETREHGDPRYVMTALRLLGEALAEHGGEPADRHQGISALNEALQLAREKEVAQEVTWTTAVLERLPTATEEPATT